MTSRPLTCAELHDLAPELALDLVTGTERAAALAHLESCAACRAEVASLTDVGEAVLALAPDVPPSAGFESRVISRIGPFRPSPPTEDAASSDAGGRRRPLGRRAGWLVGAAAVAAAVLAAVLVIGRGGGDDALAAELRTSSGRVVGEATLRGADPAEVTVEMTGWLDQLRHYGRDGGHSYWLRVGTRDGNAEAYALPLAEPDPWHLTLDGEAADAVVSVAVVDETGHTWCAARFTVQ